MSTVDGLDPQSQMIYWTGAVARGAVVLEHSLAGVYARLAGGLAWAAVPSEVRRTVSGIRAMVKAGFEESNQLRKPVVDLLADVDRAYEERNRLVHDLWAQDEADDPTKFQRWVLRGRESPKPDTRHLNDFKECAATMRLLDFRVSMLLFILSELETPGFWPEHSVWSWKQAVAGHVVATEGGGFRILPT